MDPCLLEHLEHADVREPARTARAQHERDAGRRAKRFEAGEPVVGHLRRVARREERQAGDQGSSSLSVRHLADPPAFMNSERGV